MSLFPNLKDPKVLEKMNFNRFGIMPMGMTIQSCLASIVVYEVLKHVDNADILIPLGIITPIAMASNSIALAQAPIQWYIRSLYLSVFTSLGLLAYVYSFY